MNDPHFASRYAARCFYVQDRHILLVTGAKPCVAEVWLRESEREVSLHLTAAPEAPADDIYYLVLPVFSPGPRRPHVRLRHRGGADLVPVESVDCDAGHTACPIGCSQSFRLDEAFADALRQLPMFAQAGAARPLPLVDLVAMGALYGGFSGFSRLFVRLRERPET